MCLTQRKIIARMNSARVPVKKSSRSLKVSRKRLGTGEDVQIVDHSTAPQVEEILAQSAIACASPLPSTHMGQGMFDSYPFAQFGPSL